MGEETAVGFVVWAVIGSDGELIGLYSRKEKADMAHKAVLRSDNGATYIGCEVE